MTRSSNGVTLRLQAQGKVEFTDDETDVKSLSPGGRFMVERRTDGASGDVQRFEVRAGHDGTLTRTYTKNGATLDPAEGRKWLSTFLPGLLRDMGVNARRRVARELSKGGPAAVLTLIEQILPRHGRAEHLIELYRQSTLDPGTLERSLVAARAIESDFELARVLIEAEKQQAIDGVIPAWASAAGTIQSDFEQRRALTPVLARKGLAPAAASEILAVATPGAGQGGVQSDFELATLLADARHLSASAPDAWFRAVDTIQSSFERRRALDAALKASPDAAVAGRALQAAPGITSDFEKAELISAELRAGEIPESAVPHIVTAVRGIRSDFERRRALSAAVGAPLTDSSLAQLIAAAGDIRSDFECAEALITLARHPAVGAESRKALAAAAATIRSPHERQRATAASK